MGKRALGIPHIDYRHRGARARYAALGVALPGAAPNRQVAALDTPQAVAAVAAPSTPGGEVRTANPHRQDGPILRQGVRAGKKSARPSDFMNNMEDALATYEADKFASSARATRNSLERTWEEYHAKVHQLVPALVPRHCFPVTVAALSRIAALMKTDGFRSFANYASWAKSEHIRRGYDWTAQLAQALTEALRSVNRGLGPPAAIPDVRSPRGGSTHRPGVRGARGFADAPCRNRGSGFTLGAA